MKTDLPPIDPSSKTHRCLHLYRRLNALPETKRQSAIKGKGLELHTAHIHPERIRKSRKGKPITI